MRKVIFQHLAKTAGTSLIQSLKAAFEDFVCPARYDAELTPELMLDSRFTFYHGHYSFDKVHEFKNLNPDAFAFVFLRHPVNRVLSQYYNWIDALRTRKEYAAIKERGALPAQQISEKLEKFENTIFQMSLEEFLASKDPDIVDVVQNHQTRYLSLRSIYQANALLGCANAIQNIVSFYDFVGLSEIYNDSAKSLLRALSLDESLLSSEIRANTNDERKHDGRYREEKHAILKLVALNGFDLAIFHHVLGKNEPNLSRQTLADLLLLPEMA